MSKIRELFNRIDQNNRWTKTVQILPRCQENFYACSMPLSKLITSSALKGRPKCGSRSLISKNFSGSVCLQNFLRSFILQSSPCIFRSVIFENFSSTSKSNDFKFRTGTVNLRQIPSAVYGRTFIIFPINWKFFTH